MAILIEGMEMPKDYAVVLKIFPDGKVGTVHYIQWFKVDRIEGAQAIPVPEPHGRMIDADKLKSYWEPDHSRYFDADYFIHTIDVAQTIIPASKEEVDEAQRDYQAAADYQQYCETYEQTYDPETGAM